MVRTSSGAKRDLCRVSMHIDMQNAIRAQKTNLNESCFGGKGILTKEDFKKSCQTATAMSKLGRW